MSSFVVCVAGIAQFLCIYILITFYINSVKIGIRAEIFFYQQVFHTKIKSTVMPG